MASADEPSRPSGPVVLRIKLRYESTDVMVQRFAANVGKSGLFLPTRSLQPVGAEIKFELRLANEQPVLVGVARVKAAQPPDPEDPKATFGMAVELMRVTRESRDLIMRMLERRRLLGLGDVSVPMPADIEAARRGDLVETQMKDVVSAPVAAIPTVDSRPGVLTAPRRNTGPLAVAKVLAVPTLAPEPARKKRPALGELIEQASGPVALPSLPDLDEDIDVAAVMARARVLAGSGDIDAELDALREVSSAPIEITVEAASAALAKQFGLWAPPPQVKEPEPAPAEAVPAEAVPADAVETVPSEAAPAVRALDPVETVAEAVPEPIEAAPEPIVEAAPEPADTYADPDAAAAALDAAAPAPVAEEDEYEARERARDEAFRRRHLSEAGDIAEIRDTPRPAYDVHEVEPEQVHDEIHALGENDFEEVEHTAIGADDALGFEGPATRVTDASSFAADSAMADRLDAELAAAEAEAEHDDLGIGEASAVHRMAYAQEPVAEIPPEALAPTEYAHGYVQPVEPEYEQQAEAPYDGFEGDGTLGLGAETYAGTSAPIEEDYEEIEEIEDFEILAEADAEDADLLAGHGFVPPPQESYPPPPADMLDDEPVARPSQSDFALRLDLGDDSGAGGYYPPAVPEPQDDALARSAGHALAAFDDAPAERAGAYPPLHGFDDSDVIDISNEPPRRATSTPATPTPITPVPRYRTKSPPGVAPLPKVDAPAPAADIDLESALEALDVDLDDLAVRGSGPQPNQGRARRHDDSRQPTPTPAPTGKTRARTDDGILIDFDDDDR